MNSYSCLNKAVLRRPVESAQFRSRKFVHALNRYHLIGSMGKKGYPS